MDYSTIYKIPNYFIDNNELARSVDGIAQNLLVVHSFIEVVAAACEENEDIKGCGTLMMAADLLTQQIYSLEVAVEAIYKIGKSYRTCSTPLALMLGVRDGVDIND